MRYADFQAHNAAAEKVPVGILLATLPYVLPMSTSEGGNIIIISPKDAKGMAQHGTLKHEITLDLSGVALFQSLPIRLPSSQTISPTKQVT